MANRPAPGLVLREGDRKRLRALIRSSTVPAGLAQRARIVLLAADGESNTAIADKVGVSRPTVIAWRDRYQSHELAGLDDEARSGRPRAIDRARVIAVTLPTTMRTDFGWRRTPRPGDHPVQNRATRSRQGRRRWESTRLRRGKQGCS